MNSPSNESLIRTGRNGNVEDVMAALKATNASPEALELLQEGIDQIATKPEGSNTGAFISSQVARNEKQQLLFTVTAVCKDTPSYKSLRRLARESTSEIFNLAAIRHGSQPDALKALKEGVESIQEEPGKTSNLGYFLGQAAKNEKMNILRSYL